MSAKTEAAVVRASRIESIKQSPLNAMRWCCQLDCGHDQWITARRRPTRQHLVCYTCAAHAKAAKKGKRK